MFTYKATLDRVIDGDTVDLHVDLGFSITIHERFRLAGIDTPELRPRKGTPKQRAAEKVKAKTAKGYVEGFLSNAKEIHITTEKGKGKYGRWLGVLTVTMPKGNEVNVNEWLVDFGLAKRYGGGKR